MLEGTAGFATATLKSQKGAGLFVLDVASNHIFADSAVAEVFGFSPSATENGLPLDDYLARIHPDDRSEVGTAIHESIVAAEHRQVSYSTLRLDGSVITVLAFGRCFAPRDGMAPHYSGIVVPLSNDDEERSQLLRQCLAAYNTALSLKLKPASEKLREAITAILLEPPRGGAKR